MKNKNVQTLKKKHFTCTLLKVCEFVGTPQTHDFANDNFNRYQNRLIFNNFKIYYNL